MKRAILTGAIVAAILAPTGSTGSGQPGSGPAPFPTCIIKVWEDGSAAFRDAEAVRAARRLVPEGFTFSWNPATVRCDREAHDVREVPWWT